MSKLGLAAAAEVVTAARMAISHSHGGRMLALRAATSARVPATEATGMVSERNKRSREPPCGLSSSARSIAKAWSFYDYLVKKEGKNGQRFLRAACETSKDKATFIQKWREKANEIFSFSQGDVFKAIDDRWRTFAETGQETGDTGRRKS